MRTLIRFGLCGCVTTGTDFIIYMLLGRIGVPLEVAKLLSSFIAVILSFFINRIWTFNFRNRIDWKIITRYTIAQVANMSANTIGNMTALHIFENVYIAFIFATVCGFVVNFTLQKNFVFRGL